jgi:mono/diheme cytochrome c family protein
MRLMLRILRIAAVSLVALVLLVVAALYALTEPRLRKRHAITPHAITLPRDSVSLAEGERLASILGCTGCHGEHGEGNVMRDNFMIGRIVAANLTIAMRDYSDEQLETIIRQGVRPDGKSVVAMPSGMFCVLTDDDLGKILAYLRSLPPKEGNERGRRLGPMVRVAFVLGEFGPAAESVRTARALTSSFPKAPDPYARGAYLARVVCSECHGLDLGGHEGPLGGSIPNLVVAAAYSRDDFVHLMRTGKGLGNRELRSGMSQVARRRFSRFTDGEIAEIYSYLIARAQTGSEAGR